MRVLLDACVARSARDALVARGHDVVWVGEWPKDPGDQELLVTALTDGRVLVTLDKDFGSLAVVHGLRHAGIMRLVGFASAQQGGAADAALEKYAADLARGAIVTVEPTRIRVRPAEPPSLG